MLHDLSVTTPHISRDITQISKKGKFVSHQKWEIELHKIPKKEILHAHHLILAGINNFR